MIKKLGLEPDQVHQLIDFYHAVEHLGKVDSLRKGWSSKQRKSWLRKHRNLLLKGHVDKVISAVTKFFPVWADGIIVRAKLSNPLAQVDDNT